ncbi:DUF397 domain-containing protein [Actinomadura sp. NEAU-AAG7]|nr:DUF397 domain-containing protein [Actinomadura sp. NEAU-AAG7]
MLKFKKAKRCEALNQDGCVEVASGSGRVAVRDSTVPDGPVLWISQKHWRRLVGEWRAGRL